MREKLLTPFIVALLCLSIGSTAQASDKFNRDTYVESVITVLRIHADSIKNLTTRDMKYSDNIVRHAIAIKKTFGLLGPMDWHAAESAKLMKKRKSNNADMDIDKFERMARKSKKAMQALILSTHENMEEDDRIGLLEALNNMKNSCNSCHSYLPKSVAPDVWGTLKRRK
ncbi:MAG: cytochrome c [Magnetococcales bacterium]|nr:cytochrome c [Magnetococcales bacterium]